MSKIRVIQWGSGYTGEIALRYLIPNASLELVGLKCYTEAKEGQDAGEIVGLPATGVRATEDIDALLVLDADCVIYMPRDALSDPSVPDSPSAVWVPELEQILRAGFNVVTPICSGTHHKHMADGDGFRARLEKACQAGGSTLFFTGFDPGFSDMLAFTMTSAVGEIKKIDTWEIVDYGAYTVPETLQAMGFAMRPEDVPNEIMDAVRHATWGGVPHLMAEGLGLEVERIEVTGDVKLAEAKYETEGGMTVDEGTICAMRFTITGIVDGKPLINVNHVTRLGHHLAPDWPSVGRDGGYIVEVDSYPPFRGEFPMGLPGGGGTTLIDAMTMTAARCINAVGAVVAAAPGYKHVHELPPFGGRHGFRA